MLQQHLQAVFEESKLANSHVLVQKFKSKDGTPLRSLRPHVCIDTGEHFLHWNDVQNLFEGIDHLETADEKRILYTIRKDFKLYVMLSSQGEFMCFASLVI